MRRPASRAWGGAASAVWLAVTSSLGAGCIGWGVPEEARQEGPALGATELPCGGCPHCQRCIDGACQNLPNGTVCLPDLASAPQSVCVAGTCEASACGDGIVDDRLSEECDSSPDCLTTCRWKCLAAADCDDGDPCTGVETCNVTSGGCNAGTAVTCAAFAGCLSPECIATGETSYICGCVP